MPLFEVLIAPVCRRAFFSRAPVGAARAGEGPQPHRAAAAIHAGVGSWGDVA
jgi:hypothetical protein